MPKILLERKHASGCQYAVVDVKKRIALKSQAFSTCPFGQAEGAVPAQQVKYCHMPHSPHPTNGQEAKAVTRLQMPQPLVFVSTVEVLARGGELSRLGSQALQL